MENERGRSPTPAFAMDAARGCWTYAGALNYANAGDVLAAAAGLGPPATGEIDLAGVDAVDSAAVAVLVALKRRAAGDGRPLKLINVPAALTTLADLYGVEDILIS